MESENYTEEENNILNNYMSEFKVATFKLREKTAEELEYEKKLLEDNADAIGEVLHVKKKASDARYIVIVL